MYSRLFMSNFLLKDFHRFTFSLYSKRSSRSLSISTTISSIASGSLGLKMSSGRISRFSNIFLFESKVSLRLWRGTHHPPLRMSPCLRIGLSEMSVHSEKRTLCPLFHHLKKINCIFTTTIILSISQKKLKNHTL